MPYSEEDDCVEFSLYNSPWDNTNKFLFASARQHLANRWRTRVQNKNRYLNPNAKIPTSDDARHILKFQQTDGWERCGVQ